MTDVAAAFDAILHRGELSVFIFQVSRSANMFAGKVYNIGTDFSITNLELARQLIKLLSPAKQVDEMIEHVEDRQFNDRRYNIDARDLKNLGWKPEKYWEEGLRETIEWYKDHPNHWGNINHVLVPHPVVIDFRGEP